MALLTDMNAKLFITVYIHSKDAFGIEKIEDGSYGFCLTVGNLRDDKPRKLKSILGCYYCNPPLVFHSNGTDTDIEYPVFEAITLRGVASNFIPDYFGFPDLR